jgi:pyruvate kinase
MRERRCWMGEGRKAKIVCTIGPATAGERDIEALISGGMDVARLNFSHGDHVSHGDAIEKIRKASLKLGKHVAILQDLQGIKIRVGQLEGGKVKLVKGDELLLFGGDGRGTAKAVYVRYPALASDAAIGDVILLDDGLIELKVIRKEADKLVTSIVEGGVLKEGKGVNLPGMKIRGTSFTAKDKADLAFGLNLGVDYAALSFVRSVADVRAAKAWLSKKGASIPIIVKIEKAEAIRDIDRILGEAEGIMVARGDLGVEIPLEQVPVYQKELIEKAGERRRLVITATQMLESMTVHERPTRAEAADVANAVLDGTDALMLSEETAAGKYPIQAVNVMDRIIRYTEASAIFSSRAHIPAAMPDKPLDFPEAVAHAASRAAREVGARCIAVFTGSGFTARLISKFRPGMPIVAFSPDEKVVREMALYWGVLPHEIERLESVEHLIDRLDRAMTRLGYAATGDKVVIVAGLPLNLGGTTNFMKIHVVGGV